MNITRRLASLALVAGAIVALGGTPAHADPVHTETYKSLVDNLCISAIRGSSTAVMATCGPESSQWIPSGMRGSHVMVSMSNNGCLDSNAAGQVYVITCNGGSYQHWETIYTVSDNGATFGFRNNATNRCLTVDADHNLYTSNCSWAVAGRDLFPFHLFR